MDMDIKEGAIGAEGLYDLEIKEGNLVLMVSHGSKGLEAAISLKVNTEYFIDKLAEKIPGEVDDAIFAILKGALKG